VWGRTPALLSLIACGGYASNSVELAAASDLHCPPESLRVRDTGEHQTHVEGCGRQGDYLDTVNQARWNRSDADASYSVLYGNIVIRTKDGREAQTPVDCNDAYDWVRHGNRLHVACGAGGVAVYSLDDPAHPTLSERLPARGPCTHLSTDGTCELAPSESPAVRGARAQTFRNAAIGTFVGGGIALATGLALGIGSIPASNCGGLNLGGCHASDASQVMAVTGIVLLAVGVFSIVFVGLPLMAAADSASSTKSK